MIKNKKNVYENGQALITLIFFVIIILTITTASVIILAINLSSATKLQEATLAYYIAEGGLENAILRVLRDPNYTGETDLIVGGGTVDLTVTRGGSVSIVSTGTYGKFMRKLQATLTYSNGSYTITSWKEVE